MKLSTTKRLSEWKPRAASPAIKDRLFGSRQRAEGPWVPAGFLRLLTPLAASFLLTLAVLQQTPAPVLAETDTLEATQLASTNPASANLLAQVKLNTIEWNRLALATFASTNPTRSLSSNGSFWVWTTNIFDR